MELTSFESDSSGSESETNSESEPESNSDSDSKSDAESIGTVTTLSHPTGEQPTQDIADVPRIRRRVCNLRRDPP
jgi:hypothetical protein